MGVSGDGATHTHTRTRARSLLRFHKSHGCVATCSLIIPITLALKGFGEHNIRSTGAAWSHEEYLVTVLHVLYGVYYNLTKAN